MYQQRLTTPTFTSKQFSEMLLQCIHALKNDSKSYELWAEEVRNFNYIANELNFINKGITHHNLDSNKNPDALLDKEFTLNITNELRKSSLRRISNQRRNSRQFGYIEKSQPSISDKKYSTNRFESPKKLAKISQQDDHECISPAVKNLLSTPPTEKKTKKTIFDRELNFSTSLRDIEKTIVSISRLIHKDTIQIDVQIKMLKKILNNIKKLTKMIHDSESLKTSSPPKSRLKIANSLVKESNNLDETLKPTRKSASINTKFDFVVSLSFPKITPSSNIIKYGSVYQELFSESKLIYNDKKMLVHQIQHESENSKYKNGNFMKPVIYKISKQEHEERISNYCFLGLFTIMEGLNPKKIKSVFMQNDDIDCVKMTIFNSSLLHCLFTKLMEPLYFVNFDLNLYSDHLLIVKNMLDLYMKILEFFACEMFSYLKLQHNSEKINEFEIFMCMYLLVESKTLYEFQKEILDKFILCAVR